MPVSRTSRTGIVLAHCLAATAACASPHDVVNDDGGWCWFQDERAIVDANRVVVGSVASGFLDPSRRGDVEVTTWDTITGGRVTVTLHDGLGLDDHNAPALIVRPDGRYLAVYARHGQDALVRCRLSRRAGDATAWEPERTLDAVGAGERTGVTYSNVFALPAAGDRPLRFVDYFRGDGWNPAVIVSDDLGDTWRRHGRLLGGPGRPYLKYASDGNGTIHFVASEQHPRDFDNGIVHGFVRDDVVHRSDGAVVGRIGADPVTPESLTRVFAGDADHVAWPVDLHLDRRGRPRVLFSVQRDGAGQPRGRGGADHRYHLARRDGDAWRVREIAYAGTRLYAGEDDYTGLAALDPDDPDVLYVSTDADPVTGAALVSAADGLRHREIFRGRTRDGGASWTWSALTRDSTEDHVRPIVPRWPGTRAAVLWLRGTYRTYTDYDLAVVGLVEDRARRIPAGYSLVYSQELDDAGGDGDFRFSDPAALRAGDGWLELHAASAYAPPHRSPLNIAVLATPRLGSFVLEARLQQTGRDYDHRDMCVFFGMRDPAHFYYAHLSSRADAAAHHVHIVDDAVRRPVTATRTGGVDWGRDAWHTVRVVRDAGTGAIDVYFDDLDEPVLSAVDTTFAEGYVGFGSFDDTGRVDDVRIWAPDAEDEPATFFEGR